VRAIALAAFALPIGACASFETPTLVTEQPDAAHVIWLDHPAEHFTSALPLGNGTMGALVFGGVDRERIVLNENSYWSGSVQDPNRTNAHEYLPQIRRLLLEGKTRSRRKRSAIRSHGVINNSLHDIDPLEAFLGY